MRTGNSFPMWEGDSKEMSRDFMRASGTTRRWRSVGYSGAAALAALLLAACSGGSGLADGLVGPPNAPGVSTSFPSSMTINPNTVSASLGQSTQLVATLQSANGTPIGNAAITWSSADSDIVMVTSSGVATAIGVGQAALVASAGSISAKATVTVGGDPVGTVAVAPDLATIGIGQTTSLSATVRDSSGAVLSGRNVRWISSNPAIATVDASGKVVGAGVGTAMITARSSDVTGMATVAVVAQQVTTPSTVNGLAAVPSSASSVTISFTAVSDGAGQPASYDLRYAAGGISWGSASEVTYGSCTAPIGGAAIGSTVQCTVLGLAPQTNYQFQVVAFRGALNAGSVVFGALSNVAGATTPAGLPGTPTAPVGAASVSVTPTWVSLTAGQSSQLTAVVHDASGNVMTGQPVAWTSSTPSVATVSSTGRVTAVGAGSATITASSSGLSGTSTISVAGNSTTPSPSTVSNLSATANSDSSAAITFTAVSDGTGQPASYDLRYTAGSISWGSANSVSAGSCKAPITGAAVGSTVHCTVLGLAPSTSYQFQVVAFRGSLNTGSAVFGSLSNVASAATSAAPAAPAAPPAGVTVASVIVTPSPVSNSVGQTAQFSAQVISSTGSVLSGQSITWTSSNSAIATVNASGLATSVGAGTVSILASSGGKSGSASLTVAAAASSPPPSSPPPPSSTEPMPTFGTTIWHDDFSGYSSATSLLAAYSHLSGESQIFTDATGGYGGSPAMRINWPKQTNTNTSTGGCNDDDHLLEKGFPATTEIYVQYYVRYQAGFVFDWNYSGYGPCNGNAKKLFLIPASGGRMDLIAENHHIVLYDDNIGYASGLQNVGAEFTPEMLGDGNWHRITLHIKTSTSPTSRDGFIYGWIDGQLKWSFPNANTHQSAGYDYFQMPTVFNQGSPVAQSEWADNLTVWKP